MRRFTLLVLSILVSLAAGGAWADQKQSPDWPMYIGPDGSRVPAVMGHELVVDLNAMRPAWNLRHHTGVGKGLYPGTLRRCAELGIEPFYGGAAVPIVADGTIYLSYYKPDGKHPAKPVGWRTVGNPEQYLPKWFFSVSADDILLAVDAESGEIKWQAVEPGGINRLAHKRAHWVRGPAYADGRVYSMGSAGVLRCYDVKGKKPKKLWEASTSPDLEAAREEHIKQKKLFWGAEDQSSLIVADGVVIVARESVSGYDGKRGERLWHIRDRIMSKHGTPTIWRHDGKTYVLAHTGRTGELRLIDPKDGKVLWTHTGLGPRLGTLTVWNDILIVAFDSEKGPKDKNGKPTLVRHGALRLSLKGAEKLWVMPDDPGYWFHWKHDKGPRYRQSIRDGLLYVGIGLEKYDDPSGRLKLMVVEADSGKVVSEQITGIADGLGNPILVEDRMLLLHDYAHSNPVTQSYWTAEKKPRKLNGKVAMPHDSITGYYVDLEPIYWDGRLIFRTLEGLKCYDLRRPDPEQSRTLRLTVPPRLTGRRGQTYVNLFVADGKVTHGGVVGASTLHTVETSNLRLKGDRLTGEVGLELGAPNRPEPYALDLTIGKRGHADGRMRTFERGFKKPLSLSGRISTTAHQGAWMPGCTHVLLLEDAARNASNSPGRLLLFLTVNDAGDIERVEGWADHTTKTPPAVFDDGLELENGRLTGSVVVRYRADKWTTPLVGHGTTAAARYALDCEIGKGETSGTYEGEYGIAWEATAGVGGVGGIGQINQ